MPAQSYRAYLFLKALDLDHLPQRAAEAPPPPVPAVRVRNLVAIADRLNDQLEALTRPGAVPAPDDSRAAAVQAQAQQQPQGR